MINTHCHQRRVYASEKQEYPPCSHLALGPPLQAMFPANFLQHSGTDVQFFRCVINRMVEVLCDLKNACPALSLLAKSLLQGQGGNVYGPLDLERYSMMISIRSILASPALSWHAHRFDRSTGQSHGPLKCALGGYLH